MTPLGSVGSLTTSDVSEMVESNPDWPEDPGPKLYVGVAAMTNQVGEGSFEEERINTGAFAMAFRVRGLALMGEFFTESRDILLGLPAAETDTDGWYFQGGYAFPVSELSMLEIAGRYSEILRETADDDETEVGVALTLFIRGQRNKILAEYRRLEFEGIPLGSRIDNDIFRILYQLIF